jgi:hypothetical protein
MVLHLQAIYRYPYVVCSALSRWISSIFIRFYFWFRQSVNSTFSLLPYPLFFCMCTLVLVRFLASAFLRYFPPNFSVILLKLYEDFPTILNQFVGVSFLWVTGLSFRLFMFTEWRSSCFYIRHSKKCIMDSQCFSFRSRCYPVGEVILL